MAALGEKIPQNAVLFGAAGLIPYAATSLSTLYLARQAQSAVIGGDSVFDASTALALLHHVEIVQVSQVILSQRMSVADRLGNRSPTEPSS